MMKKIKVGSVMKFCRMVDKLKLQPGNSDKVS